MRAADADGEVMPIHQLADQVAALDLGNAQAPGFAPFGVVRADGGGVYDDVRFAHVLGGMADIDLYAALLQVFRFVGRGAVGAGDRVAVLLKITGQPGHGASPDADEVNPFAPIIKYVCDHETPSVVDKNLLSL